MLNYLSDLAKIKSKFSKEPPSETMDVIVQVCGAAER
jgi:hypothetical protein